MRLDVVIVVYRPRLAELQAALRAIAQARAPGFAVTVHLWHNDEGPQATPGLTPAVDELRAAGVTVQIAGSRGNLGFGRAINAVLSGVTAPFVLLLNQDAIPEPGALQRLSQTAQLDDANVAAWEMRQIPYEHPKDYDPVSGDTGWCSGAAVLLRRDALRAVGGFEPRFFMYCEDVDLSWRLRCAGWRLRYVPGCAAVHRTYEHVGQVKPLAALQGQYANLCLRTRFAGRRHVVNGVRQLLRGLRGPQAFPGQRRGIAHALLKFARNYRYFRRTRCAGPGFEPLFNGWDYEQRREGSFHAFLAQAERPAPLPQGSVVVRASGSAEALGELLACLAQQTHPPLEVIVVGGTARTLQAVCAPWAGRLALRPLAASPAALDEVAAVHAQADWWLLIDDDRLLPYADHLEVLLQAAIDQDAQAAAALTWLIQAGPGRREQAHRLHAARTTLAGAPAERPTRLLHRPAAGAAGTPFADVAKTTAVRYVGG